MKVGMNFGGDVAESQRANYLRAQLFLEWAFLEVDKAYRQEGLAAGEYVVGQPVQGSISLVAVFPGGERERRLNI